MAEWLNAEWLNSVWRRLRARWRADRLDQDLRDEMAFHLAMRAEQLQQSGVPDAARRARRQFGNPVRFREDLRQQWTLAPQLALLGQDLRYAARTLRRKPGFALVVVLTLAFGIGINTATFSIVNAVLIRPLGFPEPERLVSLKEDLTGFDTAGVFSPPDFVDVARDQRSFEDVGAYVGSTMELSGAGSPARLDVARVSATLFPLLRVPPELGRTFRADEDRPGVDVAVISWGLWQARFNGDPAIVGKPVVLDRRPYTVIGVMPTSFEFPQRGPRFNSRPADLWVPVAFAPPQLQNRGNQFNYSVVGRLKPGTSLAAAQSELAVLTGRVNEQYPPILRSRGFKIAFAAEPFRDAVAGRSTRPLLFLFAAVGLVLLVTCANVANLLLSRAATRSGEVALRTALGSSRGRLLQLLLAEALLLASAGGALGIVLSWGIVRAVPEAVTDLLPGTGGIHLDLRVLAFCAGVTLAMAVVFALIPLLTVDRSTPGVTLQQEAARTTPGRRRHRVQGTLVVATVTLACILLVGAGLVARSFSALMAIDPGFDPENVVTASVTLPHSGYPNAAAVHGFHRSVLERVASLPGVRQASLTTDLPLERYEMRTFSPEGVDLAGQAPRNTHLSWLRGPYFETLGIELTRGRLFAAEEFDEVRNVVVINERLAAAVWPGQEAIGKRLRWGLDAPQNLNPWLTVVGVIADVVDGPLGNEPYLHAYEPFSQFPAQVFGLPVPFGRHLKVAVRGDGNSSALLPLLRSEIARLDTALAIEDVTTMRERTAELVAPRRFSALTLGGFAGGALLLAAIGLYGLLAYSVAERRREIAVRLALGAEAATILQMVAGQGLRLVGVGLIAGLAVAYAGASAVAAFLYGTHRHDSLTFVSVPLVLLVVALLACAIPAYRASRVQSLTALRGD
jgi:putative ABC transport system permease protein